MLIVGWVGVKLLMHTLAHDAVHIIPYTFVEGPIWNSIFWVVMISIAVVGWFASNPNKTNSKTATNLTDEKEKASNQ